MARRPGVFNSLRRFFNSLLLTFNGSSEPSSGAGGSALNCVCIREMRSELILVEVLKILLQFLISSLKISNYFSEARPANRTDSALLTVLSQFSYDKSLWVISELEKPKCGVKVNKIKTKINLIAIPQKQLGDHFSQYSSNYELANL